MTCFWQGILRASFLLRNLARKTEQRGPCKSWAYVAVLLTDLRRFCFDPEFEELTVISPVLMKNEARVAASKLQTGC
jgi:hypothetical protein